MKLPGKWFAICSLTLAVSDAEGGVRISEVMADPTGSGFRNEYVELINLGGVPVDLAGWAISDGASADVLVFGETSVLVPGERCLIVDPDYAGGDRPYGNFIDVFQATIEDGAIGSAGLDNVEPETLSLISAMGDTVSSVTYAVGTEGHSYERVLSGAFDGEETWAFSKWLGGTPGKRNSVSPKRYDVELRLEEPPDSVLAIGALSQVHLLLIGNGSDRSDSVSVTVTWLGGAWTTSIGSMPPGAREHVLFSVPQLVGRQVAFEAVMIAAGDEDPTNDRVYWSISFGVEPLSVVINEVMPIPAEGSEWIEILNRLDRPVNLHGWTLLDASERAGDLPDTILAAEAFLVIGPDNPNLSPGWGAVTRWPALNNGGDALRLVDVSGALIDEMSYADSPRPGRSIERIDPTVSSSDFENWIVNALDEGGTPGRENRSVVLPGAVSIKSEPDPFGERTTIRATLSAPRSFVLLQVYDRRGRLRRRLLDGVEVGSTLEVSWDGRDDSGRLVRPGVYILSLERSGTDGSVSSARALVTYAKGL